MKHSMIIFLMCLSIIELVGQKQMETMRALDYGQETKFVTIMDGIEIAYTDQGSGSETILFIHGLASYIPAWNKNVNELKNDFRCIAIDLPGYGKSSKGNYAVSMEFFADAVHSFCDKLGISQVVLAGHSMGGQIAISSALKYPELVKKLILVAPAGFETFNKGQKQWFRDVMTVDGIRLTTAEQIRLNYAYNFYKMPKDAEFMIKDRMDIRFAKDFTDYCYHITQGVQAMVNTPVFEYLHNIGQPVLCLFGENDNLIPNRYLHGGKTEKLAQQGASEIPHCELKMVEKAGHFVMFEKPEVVNQHISTFLKKQL